MSEFIIKLTGIPYSSSNDDVAVFLAGLDIQGGRKNGVHITKDASGRPSGICYVELTCQEDVQKALRKNREYMGERWINVTESNLSDMENDMQTAGKVEENLDENGVFIVKVRGVPWSCTEDDLMNFFSECILKSDPSSSIHIQKNEEGRLTGIAFVEFADNDSLQQALARDHQNMGKRYLEIERSDQKAIQKSQSSGNYSRYKEPIIMCRGLPFSTTEEDVYNFFSGLDIKSVQIVYDHDGLRPAGKCFVEFSSTIESDKALKKHNEKLGARYVEVFQSNSKYWYGREGNFAAESSMFGGRGGGGGGARPPRARPSPYSRPGFDDHTQPDSVVYGGGMRRGGGVRGGRVKHVQHSRGGGCDTGMGYDGMEGYPIQKFGGSSMGAGVVKPPQKHVVIVKGVPLDASMGDVIKFFTDSNPPKNVEMKFGEAAIEFNTHADAMMAMLKDKTNLAGVRVTLELQSKPEDYVGYDQSGMQQSVAEQQQLQTQQYADPYATGDPYQSASLVGGGYRW